MEQDTEFGSGGEDILQPGGGASWQEREKEALLGCAASAEDAAAAQTAPRRELARIVFLGLGCSALVFGSAALPLGYFAKAALKILCFAALPLVLGRWCGFEIRAPFRAAPRRALLWGALIGALAFGAVAGGYALLSSLIDGGRIRAALADNVQVGSHNILVVILYILFVNSLLEEFFFRGVIFGTMRDMGWERTGIFYSAALFSLYHTALIGGWFSPLLFALALGALFGAGLLFAWLDRRGGIFPSWIAHAGVNLATGLIGLWLMRAS